MTTPTSNGQPCEVFAPLRKLAGDYTRRCGQCSRFEHEHGAPAAREIPAGKILLAEYAELNESNRARVAILAEIFSPVVRAVVRLIHVTPGFDSAGSCVTWQNGGWRVNFNLAIGGIGGRRYSPENESGARAYYDGLTQARADCPKCGGCVHYDTLTRAYCQACKAYTVNGAGKCTRYNESSSFGSHAPYCIDCGGTAAEHAPAAANLSRAGVKSL